jgi:hypothetical protein
LLDYNILEERNKNRAFNQVTKFINDQSSAPRLPDLTQLETKYKKILEKLSEIYNVCIPKNTSRLLIFINNERVPIFDSKNILHKIMFSSLNEKMIFESDHLITKIINNQSNTMSNKYLKYKNKYLKYKTKYLQLVNLNNIK